tara:strand:+ start:362 stop:550 length:189 start_codon:yes stop_codon:yes gene_type:complete
MYDYETNEMNYTDMARFETFFENEIGTEYEVNESTIGVYYAVCCELTGRELRMIDKYFDSNK